MDLIIFDLDGTLIDSRRDIATSVNELLARQDRPRLPNERIYGFIGNGVRRLLERSLGGASSEEVEQSLQAFLPIYRRHHVTAVYDRHSYDAEKQQALEKWSRRLKCIIKV